MSGEYVRTKARVLEHLNLLIMHHKSTDIVVRIIWFSD